MRSDDVNVEKRTVSGSWKGQTGGVKEDTVDKTWEIEEAERKAHLFTTESTKTVVEYHPLAHPPRTSFRTVAPEVGSHRSTGALSRDDELL